MNKKKIRKFQIFSFIFVAILGSLLHFTYEFSGKNKFVALFSSVNESTWEHLKLLYFPMLITIIIGFFVIRKDAPNFLCAKAIGIVISISFTIIFFYTYTGILGNNISIIDIISFFISAILGEFTSYILMINKFKCDYKLSVLVLILIFLCFTMFTFHPIKIGLFKDPITGRYGF